MATPAAGIGAPPVRPVLTSDDIGRALRRIAHEIAEQHPDPSELLLVGIATRGIPLAERLAAQIADLAGVSLPVLALDATPYRDDIAARRNPPNVAETTTDLTGRTVIVVDDVLYTGRTVRAALDGISDLGRPARAQLAVLIDRGHRELPIRADYVGKNLPTSKEQRVTVQLRECDDVEGVWLESSENEGAS
jgi:pyrimidine operon attenuation protein/uracil phosphoribosyltransferase